LELKYVKSLAHLITVRLVSSCKPGTCTPLHSPQWCPWVHRGLCVCEAARGVLTCKVCKSLGAQPALDTLCMALGPYSPRSVDSIVQKTHTHRHTPQTHRHTPQTHRHTTNTQAHITNTQAHITNTQAHTTNTQAHTTNTQAHTTNTQAHQTQHAHLEMGEFVSNSPISSSTTWQ